MLFDDDVPRLTSATPPAQITIPSIEIESSRSSTVALVPHAQGFAVSAAALALFVTNNELAIAAVRHPEEAGSALSLLGTVSVRWVGIARR